MNIFHGVILMSKKRIVFLTGTRADFGKLKSLIRITQDHDDFETHIFATGMHMNSKYGKTVNEIFKSKFTNIYQFINHDEIEHMDRTLAKTVEGFSHYIAEIKPDLIVIHGDRVEALAGAIVGSLNNILVAHIEGGELSGTVDELIRHAVSKLAQIHLVGNEPAKKRLIQLGEEASNIFVIGSPDLDLMNPNMLPPLHEVKTYYELTFNRYAIVMFHPITTEYEHINTYANALVDALIQSHQNYIVIYPNNDLGSHEILHVYKRLEHHSRFKIFPSLRFEFFLRLLENADFIIGNSSAGIHEAPYYNVPNINIGTRQNNRSNTNNTHHCDYTTQAILNTINTLKYNKTKHVNAFEFGNGHSDLLFINLLENEAFWNTSHQKQFQDLPHE